MGSKMGRPKATNPLKYDLKVRFDETTNKQLETYSKKHNQPKAQIIRNAVIEFLEKHK